MLYTALTRACCIDSSDRVLRIVPLDGGVSSDIARVDLTTRSICVKRALPKLKVELDWHAPVERNAFEYHWLTTVAAIVPDAVPKVYGRDPIAGLFAMEYLDPAEFCRWKDELRTGSVDPMVAALVGDRLGRIHARTALRTEYADRFASDSIFHAIRLAPYFESLSNVHPDLSDRLSVLVETTARTRRVLIHGDVSPKISCSADEVRCFWTRNARVSAIRRSILLSVSITCC